MSPLFCFVSSLAAAQSWSELAEDLATADASERRTAAAQTLHDAPPEALAEVARSVLREVAWKPDAIFPFRGSTPLFPALKLNEPERIELLAELMAHRVALTLRGRPEVPERLEVELQALLFEEIDRLGRPQSTTDWVHLFGAAGGDVQGLIERVELDDKGQWAYVVEEDARIGGDVLRETMSLLAHRSSVVRARAARQFEAHPAEAGRVLRRAWRYAPGRRAPLRGDVAVPAIPWELRPATRWSRQLVRWARRTERSRDDRALRATLHLLTQPELTRRLTQHQRESIARSLVRFARNNPRSQRAVDLGQAMDAVLRCVPFAEGQQPAPDRAEVGDEGWTRQTPAR